MHKTDLSHLHGATLLSRILSRSLRSEVSCFYQDSPFRNGEPSASRLDCSDFLMTMETISENTSVLITNSR
jgi:hypothetical protein